MLEIFKRGLFEGLWPEQVAFDRLLADQGDDKSGPLVDLLCHLSDDSQMVFTTIGELLLRRMLSTRILPVSKDNHTRIIAVMMHGHKIVEAFPGVMTEFIQWLIVSDIPFTPRMITATAGLMTNQLAARLKPQNLLSIERVAGYLGQKFTKKTLLVLLSKIHEYRFADVVELIKAVKKEWWLSIFTKLAGRTVQELCVEILGASTTTTDIQTFAILLLMSKRRHLTGISMGAQYEVPTNLSARELELVLSFLNYRILWPDHPVILPSLDCVNAMTIELLVSGKETDKRLYSAIYKAYEEASNTFSLGYKYVNIMIALIKCDMEAQWKDMLSCARKPGNEEMERWLPAIIYLNQRYLFNHQSRDIDNAVLFSDLKMSEKVARDLIKVLHVSGYIQLIWTHLGFGIREALERAGFGWKHNTQRGYGHEENPPAQASRVNL